MCLIVFFDLISLFYTFLLFSLFNFEIFSNDTCIMLENPILHANRSSAGDIKIRTLWDITKKVFDWNTKSHGNPMQNFYFIKAKYFKEIIQSDDN